MVIACGVWSPRIAAMAGATIPLTPAVHQMADVGPIDVLVESGKELAYPIVRDMDTFMYERQSAGSMEVGSYAHRPIFHRPDDIPSQRRGRAVAHRAAVHRRGLRRPARGRARAHGRDPRDRRDPLRDQRAAVAHARRDAGARRDGRGAQPVVGRRGVDQGGARHRPARRRVDDVRLPAPVRRTLVRHHAASTRTSAPCTTSRPGAPSTSTRPTASCTPASSGRPSGACGASPFWPREEALGAVFFDARGWERPQWYESNAALLDEFPGQCERARAARVGRAVVVADHERRAPRAARHASGWSTSPRSASSTSPAPARSTRCSTSPSTR